MDKATEKELRKHLAEAKVCVGITLKSLNEKKPLQARANLNMAIAAATKAQCIMGQCQLQDMVDDGLRANGVKPLNRGGNVKIVGKAIAAKKSAPAKGAKCAKGAKKTSRKRGK